MSASNRPNRAAHNATIRVQRAAKMVRRIHPDVSNQKHGKSRCKDYERPSSPSHGSHQNVRLTPKLSRAEGVGLND
jgi:hypothetical protein